MPRPAALPLLLVTLLALTACGRAGALERTRGMAPLPVAVGAPRAQTADELIRPSTQARPQRNVDILYNSDKRAADEFDARPGAQNGQ